VPVKGAPALVLRVEIVSSTETSTNVPVAAVCVTGAGGCAGAGVGCVGFVAGGRDFGGAAEVAGVAGGFAGTSCSADDESVGASVRSRAVESAGCCALLSPFAQAATASIATAVIQVARFIEPPEL
jgi:hypothetical protein